MADSAQAKLARFTEFLRTRGVAVDNLDQSRHITLLLSLTLVVSPRTVEDDVPQPTVFPLTARKHFLDVLSAANLSASDSAAWTELVNQELPNPPPRKAHS